MIEALSCGQPQPSSWFVGICEHWLYTMGGACGLRLNDLLVEDASGNAVKNKITIHVHPETRVGCEFGLQKELRVVS